VEMGRKFSQEVYIFVVVLFLVVDRCRKRSVETTIEEAYEALVLVVGDKFQMEPFAKLLKRLTILYREVVAPVASDIVCHTLAPLLSFLNVKQLLKCNFRYSFST
jgi:hypothetical protein